MIFLLNFTGFYRNFGGLNPVVTSLIYVDLTLLGFTGYYRVLLNMNEFFRVLPGFYRVFTEFYWVLPDFHGLYWVFFCSGARTRVRM